ncbi:hypothetical protein IPM62_01990 [Candidatus Woesebacteria bacterium]|nr:MAG: hypothetical protein IPM62_01990 [Candidatus Woesebacteria bacterium]
MFDDQVHAQNNENNYPQPIQPEEVSSSQHVYHATSSKRLAQSPVLYLALIVTFGSIVTTGLLARSLFTKTPQQAASASDRFLNLSYLYKSDIRKGEGAKILYKPASLLNMEVLYVLTFDNDKYTLNEEINGIVQISGSKITTTSDNGKYTKDYKLAPEAIFFLDAGKGSLATLGRDYASDFFNTDRKVYYDVLIDKVSGEETVVVVYLTAGPDYKLNVGFLTGAVTEKIPGDSEFTLMNSSERGSDYSQVLNLNMETKIINLEELVK